MYIEKEDFRRILSVVQSCNAILGLQVTIAVLIINLKFVHAEGYSSCSLLNSITNPIASCFIIPKSPVGIITKSAGAVYSAAMQSKSKDHNIQPRGSRAQPPAIGLPFRQLPLLVSGAVSTYPSTINFSSSPGFFSWPSSAFPRSFSFSASSSAHPQS
jgi:hypothetical protein